MYEPLLYYHNSISDIKAPLLFITKFYSTLKSGGLVFCEVGDLGIAAGVIVLLGQGLARGIIGEDIEASLDGAIVNRGFVVDAPEDNVGVGRMRGVEL